MRERIKQDLEEVLRNSLSELIGLKSHAIFILGVSGFIGRWLFATFEYADKKLELNLKLFAVSRNPLLAKNKIRHFLAADTPDDSFIDYDQFRIALEDLQRISDVQQILVFHLFTPTKEMPINAMEIASRTKTILADLGRTNKYPKVIHLSSGAVYDRSVKSKSRLRESDLLARENSFINQYQQVKVEIENCINDFAIKGSIRGVNARLFAFAGPGLDLNSQFAACQFVRRAMRGEPIVIQGHPETTRTYLYPTDLIEWLLKLIALIEHESFGAVNLGSEIETTIRDLAEIVSREFDGKSIILQEIGNSVPSFYIPDIGVLKSLIDVKQRVPIESSIARWKEYLS